MREDNLLTLKFNYFDKYGNYLEIGEEDEQFFSTLQPKQGWFATDCNIKQANPLLFDRHRNNS